MLYLLLTLLFVKHFLADFLYQPPYQWQNKGTYGHIGGITHAGQHAAISFLILCFFVPTLMVAVGLAVAEFVIHYHMDWAKMKYNAYKGWKCNTHPQFWVLLGVDQLVHSLTYIGMVFVTFAI